MQEALGFSYGREDSNTPILRILTPNLMRLGRLHSRALSGPVRLPTSSSEMTRLLRPPKWFRTDRDPGPWVRWTVWSEARTT